MHNILKEAIQQLIKVRRQIYPGVTDQSGQRPGLMIGQQYNENGVALKDRKGNPLSFDPNIAANMIETGPNLEVTGIRVEKYPPDLSTGKAFIADLPATG